MAIILEPKQSLGSLLGQGLGAGLAGAGRGFGDVLSKMAENKLHQVSAQQELDTLKPLAKTLGMEGYEGLGKEGLTKVYLQKQKQAFEQGDVNAFNEATKGLDTLSSGGTLPAQQTISSNIPSNEMQVAKTEMPSTTSVMPKAPAKELQPETFKFHDVDIPAKTHRFSPEGKPQRVELPSADQLIAQQRSQGVKMTAKREKEFRNYYNQRQRDLEERYKTDLNDWREDRKMSEAKQAKQEERGGKTFDEMFTDAQSQYDQHQTYQMMDALNSKGELQTGAGPELLKKIGWEALLNPDTQQYKMLMNKNILNLAKDMKGNLSDKDVNFLTQTVANLMMTPQGIAKGLRISMLMSKMKQLPYEYANTYTDSGAKNLQGIGHKAWQATKQDRDAYGKLALKLARGEAFKMQKLPDGTLQGNYKGKWYDF